MCSRGNIRESAPALRERRILHASGELVLELHIGLELVHAGHLPVLGEAAVMQVEPGETESTLGVAAGDPHELVVDAQCQRVGSDPTRDLGRDRTQDQLAENHLMNNAPPELLRTLRKCLRQRLGAQWIQRSEVDAHVHKGLGDRTQKTHLNRFQSAFRFDRRRDAPGDEVCLFDRHGTARWNFRTHGVPRFLSGPPASAHEHTTWRREDSSAIRAPGNTNTSARLCPRSGERGRAATRLPRCRGQWQRRCWA